MDTGNYSKLRRWCCRPPAHTRSLRFVDGGAEGCQTVSECSRVCVTFWFSPFS
ncbi:hypothetical protein MHYP_G00106380 [Metynnis hypsauchen]